MSLHLKRSKGFKVRLFFFILSLLAILNIDHLGRLIYPFPYRETVMEYAAGRGLDPYLVAAVIKTESNFNPRATSRRGARGLMQVMPETGTWAAKKMGLSCYHPDLLYDPEFNIRIGTWYLADLYRTFDRDTILALAAYNGGQGNVQKWLEQQHWTGEKSKLDQIPFAETREFVRKVLWNYQVYRYLYGR
ncbi:Lytic transglycosylase catalytic [Desulfofundulus kuznetsovii DSM 6115]|uniref:Lytic transglycosylase catalytic n=1 Tax=Desulfofundulus kuznetsovii (strain DSM 6115 / VKM B-1805 / 17) TaxID=760568 RepID=A0AAU8PF67_DESK7|nr:Lytic transglycosylase catalytic [Desulfofundulus kuznetsovii DSM 6115]